MRIRVKLARAALLCTVLHTVWTPVWMGCVQRAVDSSCMLPRMHVSRSSVSGLSAGLHKLVHFRRCVHLCTISTVSRCCGSSRTALMRSVEP